MREKNKAKRGFFSYFFRLRKNGAPDQAFESLYETLFTRFQARMQRSKASQAPFIFPASDPTAVPRTLFSAPRIALASFAVAVFAAGTVFLLLQRPNPNTDIAYEHIGNFEVIHAPRKIIHPNGSSIVLKSGKIFVKKISEGKTHPILHLYAEKISADFDFKSRIDFSVEGPDMKVTVLGTAFSLNWSETKNEVFVTRGKVSVANLLSGEVRNLTIGQGVVMQSDRTCYFSGEKACEIGKTPEYKIRPAAGKQVILRLTDGTLFDGTILQETENEVTLKTAQGEKKFSRSDIEDRVDKSWLKRQR